MIVSRTTPVNPLQTKLEAGGLSSAKAKLVQTDLDAAIKEAAGATTAKADTASVREALDKRIAGDVASGKLSKTDAAQITKTLDEIDQKAGNDATAKAPAAKRPGGGGSGGGVKGGGGGGGGSGTQTELSRTVLVAGTVKTTTITYTDGSTTTETSVASPDDKTKYAKTGDVDQTSDDTTGAKAQDYLAGIAPGSLLEKLA